MYVKERLLYFDKGIAFIFERMGMFEEISHSKWKFHIVVKEELYAF